MKQTSKLSVIKNKLYKGKFHKEVYSRIQFLHLKDHLNLLPHVIAFLSEKTRTKSGDGKEAHLKFYINLISDKSLIKKRKYYEYFWIIFSIYFIYQF